MGEPVNDPLVDILRSIQGDVATLKQDVRDIRIRMGEMNDHLLALRRDGLANTSTSARQQGAIERLRDRVDRIETRLNLSDQ